MFGAVFPSADDLTRQKIERVMLTDWSTGYMHLLFNIVLPQFRMHKCRE